jgi:hypothetical protein
MRTIFSLNVLRTEELLAINIKTRKGKSGVGSTSGGGGGGGGRRHLGLI